MVANRAFVFSYGGNFMTVEQFEILVGDFGNSATRVGAPSNVAPVAGHVAPHNVCGIEDDHGLRSRLVRQGKTVHSELHGNGMSDYSTFPYRDDSRVDPGG